MNKKIYKLKPDSGKYIVTGNSSLKPFNDFQLYINKSRIQKVLNKKEDLRKQYCRRYRKPSIWWVVLFYYGFITLILLLKKLGF